MNDLINQFAANCREKLNEFEQARVKVGITGPSGSGKSSLINAIFGEKVAAVGVVETTLRAQEFIHGSKGLSLVDLPGCGTRSWPKVTYIDRLELGTYDAFLLVTANRFTENDEFLYRELTSRGKPCFVLRNKFDQAVADGLHDNCLAERQVRSQIEADIRANLRPSKPNQIYLTSGRHPARYDLGLLLNDISNALSGIKRDRFNADMAAYTEESLKKKRALTLEFMPMYAGLAAANGLNPIPGLDVAADIALLLKMGATIAQIYGLTSNQLEFIKRMMGPKALPGLLVKLAQFSTKYLVKEGVMLLLKGIAMRMTAKEGVKFLPFVGPLIAAGIGWKAAYLLGDQMIDEAESLAREILDTIVRASALPNTAQ